MRFAKLNVDENPATSSRFNVRSIPALLVFKAGREVDRLVGVQPKPEFARRLRHVTSVRGDRWIEGGREDVGRQRAS